MSPATRLRLFYFLYYGSVGANLPYFSPYLRGLGFTGGQIGTVQMLGPLLAAPVALSWAAAADRLGSPARALRLASLWTLGAILFLPWARTPVALAAVLLLQGLADRAVVPLVDAVSMEHVKTDPRLSYARIRLFGSLGYVVLSLGVGLLLWARGDRPADLAVPLALVACVAGYALAARRLPSPPRPEERPRLREVLDLLRSRPLVALLAVATVHWAATAPFHVLFGVHVRDLGLAAWVTGVATSAGVAAEIAALLLFPRLEARLPARGLFALAFAGSAVRWLLAWRVRSMPAVIAVQLLHGLTFGVFWGASVRAMGRLVPARLRASGQALFSAAVFGGGNALGYQLSGRGYDLYGAVAPLFAWAAAAEALALAGALLLTVGPGRDKIDQRGAPAPREAASKTGTA